MHKKNNEKVDGANNSSPLTAMVNPGSALAIALSNTEAMTALGSIWVAKQMPRNMAEVEAKVKQMCAHDSVAEKAFFSFKRGGSEIAGETIHLANVCMTAYGNIESGWKKIGEHVNKKGVTCSECEAYCFDKESNIIRKISFSVPHFRETKDGGYGITSDRDIYELCANMASRRMRACIWGVIPEFVRTLAADECRRTLERDAKSSDERIKKLLEKFSLLKVSKEMIEKKLGHPVEECTVNEIIHLGRLHNAIAFNIVSVEDQFGEEKTKDKEASDAPIFKKKSKKEEPREDVIDAEKVEEPNQESSELFKTPFDE